MFSLCLEYSIMDQRNFTKHKQIIVFSGKIKRPINIVGKGESEALGLVLLFIFDKSGTQSAIPL